MKYQRSLLYFILFSLFPVFLFSACSDKSKYVGRSDEAKPWLGIQVGELSENRLKKLNLDFGLKVGRVFKDSPAEEAGLKEGDILLRLNGETLEDSDKLVDLIEKAEIDDRVDITYVRDGEKRETSVILPERDFKFHTRHFSWHYPAHKYQLKFADRDVAWLGVSTSGLTPQLREYFGVKAKNGVLIREVVESSPAEKYGLQAGDIIITVDNRNIYDPEDLSKTIFRCEPEEEVVIHIIRNKSEQTVNVTLGERKGTDFRYFGYVPDEFEINIPEIDIDIPEINRKIPPIDEEKWEELNERLNEEMEDRSEELDIKMEELHDKLENIQIRLKDLQSTVI